LAWEKDFVSNLSLKTLYTLILASNFLDFKELYDVACKAVASQVASTTSASEMRKLLGVPNDYTTSEEKLVKIQNSWIETGKFS
jgi:hypothetical protein